MKRRNYWVIADTHFSHDKLVKTGYRKEGFEMKILANMGKVVKKDDIVIHLGDVSFYKHRYWTWLFTSFGCKSYLVKGNHDKQTNSWYLSNGWDFVADSFTLDIYGKKILFTHVPVAEKGDFDINCHGHLHNLHWREDSRKSFNCLVQIEDTLAPVNLNSLIDNHAKNN